MMLVDSVLLVMVLLLSFSIRLGYLYWPESDLIWLIFASPVLAIPIFFSFGLYRVVIRYIGFNSLWRVFQATTLYALLWSVFGLLIAVEGIPRSVILINWLLIIVAIGGSRMTARWLLSVYENDKNTSERINVLICLILLMTKV